MNIMISVGESSGDIHTAHALDQLRQLSPSAINAFGMGGKRLAESGMEIVVDNRAHSVMGLVEVLNKYPTLRANLNTLRRTLQTRRPDLLLVVDYPHFNMKLAATAKSLDIPVLYYIAPKVWASRPGRIEELRKLVDHMAVILPFEAELFQQAHIEATYTGNPLLDNKNLLDAREQKSLNHVPLIALLPGSRTSEINYLLPTILDAASKLAAKYRDAKFIMPVADTIDKNQIQQHLQQTNLSVELVAATDHKAIAKCDIAIVASGTATLEMAILGIPMVVVYRMNQLSYAIVKRWLTIKRISLVNIIAQKDAVPELLQEHATAENIFAEASVLLSDVKLYRQQQTDLGNVCDRLGTPGAAKKLAGLIVTLVEQNKIRQTTAQSAVT